MLASTYYRILLGMSAMDVFASFFTGTLNTVLVSRDSGGWGAYGNTATCSFSGFWNQLQVGVPLYNASLAVYFWVYIPYGGRSNTISSGVAGSGGQILRIMQWVEPVLHTVPWAIGIGTASLGVVKQWFNAQVVPEIGCWIEP